MLSNTGLVTTFTPFKGTAVRVVDQELAWSIYEVRLLLEPELGACPPRISGPSTVRQPGPHSTARLVRAASGRLRRTVDGEPAVSPVDLELTAQIPVLLSFLNQVQDLVALISVEGWRLESESGRLKRWKREHAQHALGLRIDPALGRADEAAEGACARMSWNLCNGCSR